MKPSESNQLTFLIFKDGLVSRTFQVSLTWISRFGIVLAISAAITLGSAFVAMKYYRAAKGGKDYGNSPLFSSKESDLQKELADLRSANQSLLNQLKTGTANSAVPATSAPVSTATASFSNLFSALPQGPSAAIPDRASLPFTLDVAKVTWSGNTLKVGFAIQYIRDDGGNQQGHIIILARGPETLLAYPDGVLNPVGSDTLIRPESGEYFSVSRFREVKAEFTARNQSQITEVEVLLVDQSKQLLISQKYTPEKSSARRSTPETPKKLQDNSAEKPSEKTNEKSEDKPEVKTE